MEKSNITFADEALERAFWKLEVGTSEEQDLHNHLEAAFEILEENIFAGIQIQKRLIPKEYKQKNATNLWKVNLPRGWRLLYHIKKNEVIIDGIIFF